MWPFDWFARRRQKRVLKAARIRIAKRQAEQRRRDEENELPFRYYGRR